MTSSTVRPSDRSSTIAWTRSRPASGPPGLVGEHPEDGAVGRDAGADVAPLLGPLDAAVEHLEDVDRDRDQLLGRQLVDDEAGTSLRGTGRGCRLSPRS